MNNENHLDIINGQNPVLFIGSGFSKRYCLLENGDSFPTWVELLKKICLLISKDKYYYDLIEEQEKKSQKNLSNGILYQKIALTLEEEFTCAFLKRKLLDQNLQKQIEFIYDKNKISPMKLFISLFFSNIHINNSIPTLTNELEEFKKTKEHVASYITTNYDEFIESQLGDVAAIVGDSMYLEDPEYNLFKIHGSIIDPKSIVITKDDYREFDERDKVIQAKLINQFVSKNIIFLGYSINDDNIKKILSSIFSPLEANGEIFNKIKNNFILIEYKKGEDQLLTEVYNLDIGEGRIIPIKKISTDNYKKIYSQINEIEMKYSLKEVKHLKGAIRTLVVENKGPELKVAIPEGDIGQLSNNVVLNFGVTEKIVTPDKIDFFQAVIHSDLKNWSSEDILRMYLSESISADKNKSLWPIFKFFEDCRKDENPIIENIRVLKILQKASDSLQKEKLKYLGTYKSLTVKSVLNPLVFQSEFGSNSLIEKQSKQAYLNYQEEWSNKDTHDYIETVLNITKNNNLSISTTLKRLIIYYEYKNFNGKNNVSLFLKK